MNELSINTSQNVNVNFLTASLGERILAFGLDLILKGCFYFAVYLIAEISDFPKLFENFDQFEMASIIFILAIPLLFYTLFFETLFDGQTPGKKIMKIKVVKIDGYQCSFADYLMRWVFRVVEIYIMSGIITVITIILNNKNQRLGDIVAGTAVISIRNKYEITNRFLDNLEDNYEVKFPQVLNFSDNDMRIIIETFQAATSSQNFDLITQLTAKMEAVLQIKNPYDSKKEFINQVLKDYTYLTSK